MSVASDSETDPVTGLAAHDVTLTPTWFGDVPATVAAAARDTALEVARRLRDPRRAPDLVVASLEQAVHPMGWSYPGLAHGHTGLALLQLEAARAVDDRTEREEAMESAWAYIREAVAGTRVEPLDTPGLFSGTSGLALGLADCVRDEPRFGPSLDRLHESLAAQVADLAPPRVERSVTESHYDLIAGTAGVLSYLAAVPDPSPAVAGAARTAAAHLTWLGGAPVHPGVPHRWLVTPECVSPHEREQRTHAGGHLNLGTAHGVPGAVAALASAWRSGLRVPGQEAAIGRMTSWILAARSADQFGPLWPTEVGVHLDGSEVRPYRPLDQLAWCYGTAGVAASLLSVADALDDARLRMVALDAFGAVLRRTVADRSTTPTLCHGRAGLLVLCLEVAASSGSAAVLARVPRLVEDVLGFADPDRPLLFADEDEPGNLVDSPSLLTGATGVALALFAAVGPSRPSWLSAFVTR